MNLGPLSILIDRLYFILYKQLYNTLFTASLWLQPSIKYQSPRVVVGKAEVNTKTNNHKSGKLANSETTTKTKIYARWNLKLFFSY